MNQMTQDLKETLNLPKTSFSMKANLSQREPNFVKFWQDQNIYEKMIQDPNRTETFILNDGPPYANGPIHIGHSVNKILKDFIVKSQFLSGKKAPYIPGWDCHGLPIEVQIEKKFGRGKLTPDNFREKCRQYAQSQIEIQCEGFKRLGVLGQWEHPYKTMQPSFEASIVKQFLTMVEKGTVKHGLKPVHWCPHCLSALSDAETEFADKESHAIDVAFKVAEKAEFFSQMYTTYLVIWTTTPWTLPANQAVAYSKDISYIAVKKDDQVYLMAENLKERCLKAWSFDPEQVEIEPVSLEQIQALQHAHHPLYGRLVPVVPAKHVTDESGTGFVHTAPDHGPEDFLVGQEYQLKPLDLLDDAGRFKEHVADYAGLKNFQAEQAIIDNLKAQGHLLAHSLYQHSYPVCWRHKKPIFFRTTPQWFVSLHDDFKSKLLQNIDKVQWFPSWGQERMRKMIENRPDWCISRQRHWGTPLTLIYDKNTYEIHPQMQEIGQKIIKAIEADGIEVWFNSTLEDWGVENPKENWVQSFDTLDVWFDSGSVFHLLEREKLGETADLYLEGNDQYRGWFQSSLINSIAYQNKAPYKTVLTHGMVVDSHGKKMSKSLGNVVAPSEVAQKYGIDILRLWVAMSDYREELAIGDVILARTADVYRRLRNTLRFILGNLHEFDVSKDALNPEQCALIDQYTLVRLAQVEKKCREAYQNYRFDQVARTLVDFSVNDLGANYLDIIKDRLYTSNKNSQARRSAQTVLYHLYHSLVRLLAPILSFTAEDAWQHNLDKETESIFLERFLPLDNFLNLLSKEQQEKAQLLLKLKKDLQVDMELMRKDGKIGSALEVHLHLSVPKNHVLVEMKDELAFIFLVSKVTVVQDETTEISWTLESLSDVEKCARCWFRVPLNSQGICQRCETNIAQPDESRIYG